MEADLRALLENETQKLGSGWFYLKIIIISSMPVDPHVKALFPERSQGRGGGSDLCWDPPLPGALQGSCCPQRRARDRPQLSPFVPQPFLRIEESENKVFEANVTILSSVKSKINEALKT